MCTARTDCIDAKHVYHLFLYNHGQTCCVAKEVFAQCSDAKFSCRSQSRPVALSHCGGIVAVLLLSMWLWIRPQLLQSHLVPRGNEKVCVRG